MDDEDRRRLPRAAPARGRAAVGRRAVRLHRAHVERVPYETVWLHLGQPWTVDPRRVGPAHRARGPRRLLLPRQRRVQRVAAPRSATTCTRHVGGVHGPDGPTAEAMANHLVLTVRGPALRRQSRRQLVRRRRPRRRPARAVAVACRRVRAGSVPLHARRRHPARSATGTSPTTRAARSAGMSWRVTPAEMRRLRRASTSYLSTSPESLFVQYLSRAAPRRRRRRRDGGPRPPARRRAASRRPTAVAHRARRLVRRARPTVFGLRLRRRRSRPRSTGFWDKTFAAHHAWEATSATPRRQ